MKNPVAKNVHKFYKNFVIPSKKKRILEEEVFMASDEDLEEFLATRMPEIQPTLDRMKDK